MTKNLFESIRKWSLAVMLFGAFKVALILRSWGIDEKALMLVSTIGFYISIFTWCLLMDKEQAKKKKNPKPRRLAVKKRKWAGRIGDNFGWIMIAALILIIIYFWILSLRR